MLCSAKELDLAQEAEGILILPPDAPLGGNFLEYLGLPDCLFELEIFPNRPDLLSHFGVAREVSALFNCPLRFPAATSLTESSTSASERVKIAVENKESCPLYTCRILEGVKIGPSPRWLSQILERMGQRSINNVVDVTNYVMLEIGQPLHAFDYEKLEGKEIQVRFAKKGEKIPLLDNSERDLEPSMVVIADSQKPVALAGIMGGSNSQVSETTRNLLLEAALFHPGTVRKTARRLAISTDSSYRFERGVDPQGVEWALNRAAQLLLEVAGGSLLRGIPSQRVSLSGPSAIEFRPARAQSLLGVELAPHRQLLILKNLGCTVEENLKEGPARVTPPSARLDLAREIDLIEEVARVAGYDLIPSQAPKISSHLSPVGSAIPLENEARSLLHQYGFFEAVNSTFLPADYTQKLRLSGENPAALAVSLLNPIAEDQKVLRPTLLPSLLANVQLNLAHQQPRVALYELNKVFGPQAEKSTAETFRATAVLAGLQREPTWTEKERAPDFYDVKGLAESLLQLARQKEVRWEFGTLGMPYRRPESFKISHASGDLLAWGGMLSPLVLKNFGLEGPVAALEIDLTALGRSAGQGNPYRPLPRFPEAWRDIALVVPDGVTSAQVVEGVEASKPPFLVSMALFDQYRGPGVPEGSRSLAFRLRFRHEERTLTDAKVSASMSQILSYLKERFSIAIR